MPSGGRPKNPVWEHYTEVVMGGRLYAKCIYCELQLSNKAARMKLHFEKCRIQSRTDQFGVLSVYHCFQHIVLYVCDVKFSQFS
jgi:hypothetical protein